MNLLDWFQSEKGGLLVAGAAGAAVGAAADWQGWKRGVQHFVVGVPSAYFGSDIIYAVLSGGMDWISVPIDKQLTTSGFIAGAVGIVFIQFIIAFFRKGKTHDGSEKS